MFKTLKNAWKIEELQNKILFTLLIILLYRIGSAIPVPYVSREVLSSFDQVYGGTIFGYMSLLSGGAMSQATLFALSVQPYITSSIVVQLLAVAFPKIAGDGENGKQRMQTITRYVTVGVALVTAIGYYMILKNSGALMFNGFFYALIIVACYCAGSSLVMWLGEKINEHGIGNGISLILFANIISSVPSLLIYLYGEITSPKWLRGIIFTVGVAVFMCALIWLIIYISDSERRIPVQYAKKVVGRKMYGGQNTNLPIKLNMTGVMPIIFANAIVSIPSTINMFVHPEAGTFWYRFFTWFTVNHWVYAVLTLILIVFFAYFYTAISFNPVEVANNMQKNGGSIPGVRPGRATSDFITKILHRVTLIGALYLAVIAVLPVIVNFILVNFIPNASDLQFGAFAFGGSSIIIVVGVILETAREIEAQMTMRHYKGFLD